MDPKNMLGAGDLLAAERDRRIDLANEEREIVLKLGEKDVTVLYIICGDAEQITEVSIDCAVVSLECFSAWQMDNWAASIRKHERALADEAWEAARDAA